jgi:hypothetical protein
MCGWAELGCGDPWLDLLLSAGWGAGKGPATTRKETKCCVEPKEGERGGAAARWPSRALQQGSREHQCATCQRLRVACCLVACL